MEFLQEILGEELYARVAEKLAGSGVKLADLSGGAYVSRKKFDAQRLRAERAERDAQERVRALEFNYALDSALAEAGARSVKAVKALIDRESLRFSGGELQGLAPQLDRLREEAGYLFAGGGRAPYVVQSTGAGGQEPAHFKNGGGL